MFSERPFVSKLTISNFRCFENVDVEFAIPDGSPGSGLNLLIGNNGTGKTTILEAVDYLFGGRYKGESRLSIGDFKDFEKPILVEGTTGRFSVKSGLEYLKGKYFNCIGVEFAAQPRERKQAGKLLSGPITARSKFCLDENTYFYEGDDSQYIPKKSGAFKTVDNRELTLDSSKLGGNGLNVFYFDKNRARHLASGTYRTTFDAICDDLNWKFQKKLRSEGSTEEYSKKVTNELFGWAMNLAQKGTGDQLSKSFSEFFGQENFRNLRFDLLSLLEPFSSSFLAIRADEEVHQISTKKLGSGVELILALLLQRMLTDSAKGDKVLLIDEPEMHLHPTAQRKLAELLIEEAKNCQVIVSTHSPYILQALLDFGLTNVFSSVGENDFCVEPQRQKNGIFPWSPSTGEVNYKAFGMPSVEFHNELYGFIQDRGGLSNTKDIDEFFNSKGIASNSKWTDSRSNKTYDVTTPTFVRHSIHHPENKLNVGYDEATLALSTELLVGICENWPIQP